MITDRNILVTGGAGSVGPALIERFLDHDPRVIRIFDNNEPALADMKRTLDSARCRFLIGDVRDRARLTRAMDDIDIVVHAAAMKHVDISEYNPFEAVKTNVLGLQKSIDVAIDSGVERFIFTSSDKAVNPANTMGTTKLLGEKLVTAGNKYRGTSDIRLSSIRFGNVVNSSHSVVPVFEKQIANGGPVTLTDARMSRFFITYGEICELVIKAIERTQGGEIFINKMPAVEIDDLAKTMIETIAPTYERDPGNIEIIETGMRIGETLHEEIMTRREGERVLEDDSTYAIPPQSLGKKYFVYGNLAGFEPATNLIRTSKDATSLSCDEIKALLSSGGWPGPRADKK